jgi:xanthine phosphoribosyltransferase
MPGAPLQRNAVAEKAFHVSWDQFHRDARALAWRLSAAGRFSGMVAITRGGLVPRHRRARTRHAGHRDNLCRELCSGDDSGEMKILQSVFPDTSRGGEGLLVVGDLADTGATVKIVRAILPKAHVATVYAKPLGRPFVDTFVTEVSQDTWIYFPWDLGLSFQAPIAGPSEG